MFKNIIHYISIFFMIFSLAIACSIQSGPLFAYAGLIAVMGVSAAAFKLTE